MYEILPTIDDLLRYDQLERKHKISLDQVRDNEKSREKAREGESGM
jgi:hypothetical protein